MILTTSLEPSTSPNKLYYNKQAVNGKVQFLTRGI